MSINGSGGVIHTKSSYASKIKVSIGGEIDSFENVDSEYAYKTAFSYLISREIAFYNLFFPNEGYAGYSGDMSVSESNYNIFMKAYREALKDRKQDIDFLKRFTNLSLSPAVPKINPSITERHYKIQLVGEVFQLAKKWSAETKNFKIKFEEGMWLEITADRKNASLMQYIINEVENRYGANVYDYKKGTVSNRYKNYLSRLFAGEGNKIFNYDLNTSNNSKSTTGTPTSVIDVTKVSNYKTKKAYWEEVEKENPEEWEKVQQAAIEATNYIHDFIFKGIGGCSNEMKTAVNNTWNGLGLDLENAKVLLEKSPFFQGENYNKAILGALGEFANNAWLEYLKILKGKNDVIARIIGGGDLEEGIKLSQQPRTDVQLLQSLGADAGQVPFGFQTKNVQTSSTLPVNTTPALIEPNFPGVSDVLVNAYSNSNSMSLLKGEIEDFKKQLEYFFFYAMNLNVSEGLDSLQTNTFYFIGGEHLVPASYIIKSLYDVRQKKSNLKFKISGGNVSSYTDAQYKKNFSKNHYWTYEKGSNPSSVDDMIPTGENESAFTKNAKAISISTKFTVGAGLLQEKNKTFSIFNI